MDITSATTPPSASTVHRPRRARLTTALASAIAVAAVGLATGCSPAASHADTVVPNATVLKVIDGDTVDVRSDQRGRLRIRILGINTPETKFKLECGGPEASTYGHKLLDDQRVAIVTDPTQDSTDRFGRTLAYVFLASGDNYSVLATRSGHARAYVYGHRPSQWADRISSAERQAQADGIGIWGEPCRTKPGE
ncbi:thermonuclease family protein [Mycobacteroides abscessus]|uniref:thermonuclease family protein n=1 Tax=Mycobacteroides abscessus TaxID=36809 RepID=UPI000C2574BB|nr:thermonuclease family protein [Mycobacteroides abscessus]MBN7374113.1 thermonuclease family protein [Mycobacteroides abscessus subsp. abscessus]RIR16470.1 nuclease [Mycobacteroides abscessus]